MVESVAYKQKRQEKWKAESDWFQSNGDSGTEDTEMVAIVLTCQADEYQRKH